MRSRPRALAEAADPAPGPPRVSQQDLDGDHGAAQGTASSMPCRRRRSGAGACRWAARRCGSPRSRSRTRAPRGSAPGTRTRAPRTGAPSAAGTGGASPSRARRRRAARPRRGARARATGRPRAAASRPPSRRRTARSAGRGGCRSLRSGRPRTARGSAPRSRRRPAGSRAPAAGAPAPPPVPGLSAARAPESRSLAQHQSSGRITRSAPALTARTPPISSSQSPVPAVATACA